MKRAAIAIVFGSALACSSAQPRSTSSAVAARLQPATPEAHLSGAPYLPLTLRPEGITIGNNTEIAAAAGGCMNTTSLHAGMFVCPEPTRSLDGRTTTWRVQSAPDGPDAMPPYSVSLAEDGHQIKVVAGGVHSTVMLGDGPAARAAREHPERLGPIFAFGLEPASRDGVFVLSDD